MITRTRSAKLIAPASQAAPSRHGQHALAVSGAIPADLDGYLLQAAVHPAASPAGAGTGTWTAQAPLVNYGIRLAGGRARWHRQGVAAPAGSPVWRAARVWPGGQGPDAVGAAAVARPAADPAGGWHTIATYPGLGHAEHLQFGSSGQVRHAEPVSLDGAPLVHAVAATDRFVVLFDLPVTYRRSAALVGARFPYAWEDGRPARLGLLGRSGEEPRWFPIGSCYVFNPVNAYDDGDRVVIDVIRHERAFDTAGRPARPRLWRWILDLRDGTVQERPLAATPQEWPAIDRRVQGRRHRYVFTAGLAGEGDSARGELTATALVRHDLATGTTQVRRLEPGCTAGQPVFVPRPVPGREGQAAEGDGWLIAVVHDAAHGRSRVLVLDAADLAGPPVATVHLPVRLPASLYTSWRPAA